MHLANIKRLIKDAFSFQKKIEELTTLMKGNLQQIHEHFDSEAIRELEVEAETEGDIALIAKKSERVTVEYFPDKLEKKLSSELFNEVVNKSYAIIDMPALIILMRSHGISPKDFKKLIRVDQSVNRPELKRLYDDGEITKSDIKGCFSAKISKSIKISRKVNG